MCKFDPTLYADPLFGVGSATSAGPTLPAGSIHPSPETLEKDNGGYSRNQPIVGFGQAYLSGSGGKKCYGNFLLCPTVDGVETDAKARARFATEEKATCFEYRCRLENGIAVKMTPAHNAAIYTIDYPADREACLFFDLSHKLDLDEAMLGGQITLCPEEKTILGGGTFTGNLSKIDWEMYVAMQLDGDFLQMGYVYQGTEIPVEKKESLAIRSPQRLGSYVKFAPSPEGRQVKVKIAISFVSAQRALEHLKEEIPCFDYDKVREAARAAWRDVFSAAHIATEDPALLRRFYTAMYHMHVQPRDRRADHGTWDDFHTVWDTWKTLFPLYSLLYPEKMGAILDSFLDRAEKNRKARNGIVWGDEYVTGKEFLAGQGGNDTENAVVDACLKQVPLCRHTRKEAYEALLESARQMRSPEYVAQGFATKNPITVSGQNYSFRFKSGSATMGFAFNDKAIARLAQELGTPEEREFFEKRSANWRNVWNGAAESEGFLGFPQNPEEDGSFAEGFDPHGGYNSHFYEATAWDASYINYNDMPRLVETMGGKEEFIRRLLWACEHSVNYYNDDEGKEGYLNFTNEPSFHIPWLFCTEQIRRPDLAAKVIDGVLKRFRLENDYPGDEDNGGMSSFYFFLLSGFFPFATTEKYYLHGTRLKEMTLRLGNGKTLCIVGENTAPDHIYVQSASFQGKPLKDCWLTHAQLTEGGTLRFVMGKDPSRWGWEE